MGNKINVSELLKDCPQGMELNCTMFDDNCMEFNDIVDNKFLPIRCRIKLSNGEYNFYNFTKYGCWINDDKAKCVIFPKGKTTWEGFQRPFKDGDIVYLDFGYYYKIIIFKRQYNDFLYHHVILGDNNILSINTDNSNICTSYLKEIRYVTEEEKQKIFDAIKANGYKWNPETKTLEKLPKFKVGDKVKHKDTVLTIITVQTDSYIVEDEPDNFGILMFSQQNKWELINEPKFKVGDTITNGKTSITIGYTDNEYYYEISRNIANRLFIKHQDEWNLVPNKFDFNTLKPFDQVLVRCSNDERWVPQFFAKFRTGSKFPFECTYNSWIQCVPYKGNEYLYDTTDNCSEFYRIWKDE